MLDSFLNKRVCELASKTTTTLPYLDKRTKKKRVGKVHIFFKKKNLIQRCTVGKMCNSFLLSFIVRPMTPPPWTPFSLSLSLSKRGYRDKTQVDWIEDDTRPGLLSNVKRLDRAAPWRTSVRCTNQSSG